VTSVAPVNRVSARIADVEVASYNVTVLVCGRFDIVYAAGDIVFGLAGAAVHYAEVYSAVAFASTKNQKQKHQIFLSAYNEKQRDVGCSKSLPAIVLAAAVVAAPDRAMVQHSAAAVVV